MKAAACAVALCLASAASLAQPVFRSRVDAVRVDVLVTDGGHVVEGLSARDFDLRDRGVPQTIDVVAFEEVPLRVLLALDVSGSVRGSPLGHLKEAATAVIHLLAPHDRAAVMTFSGSPTLAAGWTADRSRLESAIAGSEAGGATALHDAAYAALTLRDPEPGRTLVLVFSDGSDTASWLSGQAVIDVAKQSEVVVYAVGLGGVDAARVGFRLDVRSGLQARVPNVPERLLAEPFLRALADETGGRHLTADSGDRLRDTFVRIVNEFRGRYLLTYVPRGVDAGGWHPIAVSLKGRTGKVTARRGYLR